jgi:uncharacterized protein (DUF1697 family)
VSTWVALLRAVNLGSRNKVSMPALRESLAAHGFQDVRTYVQSGNVIASSEHSSPAEVADEMSALVKAELGLDGPITVRTAEQLNQVIAANPYAQAAQERPKLLHVSFLFAEPDPERVAAVHGHEVTKDVCGVVGDSLYIDYRDGVQGSKLTSAYLARQLGVDGTARNWRTVTTLAQMAAESRR